MIGFDADPRGKSRAPRLALAGMFWAACLSAASPSVADSDDRAVAEALLKPAETAAGGQVTAEALAHANQALERATRLRAAGDEPHARAAEGVAREWAETARDLGLAAAAEKMAEDRKRQAMQALAQLQRTKALVEEGIARLGRLRAKLDSALVPAKMPAKTDAAVGARGGPPQRAREEKRDKDEATQDKARNKAAASPSGATP